MSLCKLFKIVFSNKFLKHKCFLFDFTKKNSNSLGNKPKNF